MSKELKSGLVFVVSMLVWTYITLTYSGEFTQHEAEAIFIGLGAIIIPVVNGIAFLIIWRKDI
jgi:hypothetical protein